VFLWLRYPNAQQQTIQYELVVNWEALPLPQTENLFERKVVIGSQEQVAVAVEESGTAGSATTTWANFGDAALDAVASGISAAVEHRGGVKSAIMASRHRFPA